MPVFSPQWSNRGGYPLALVGATAAARFVGGTASGAPASGTFAVGDFVIDQTGKVFVCTAAGSPGTWVQAGGGGVGSGAGLWEHQAASGSNAGGATSGSWQTRPLTTEVYDTANIGSLAANVLTLIAGTYRVQAWAKFYQCGQCALRLRNTADGTTLAVGVSGGSGAADTTNSHSLMNGRFTLAASKTCELQYFVEATKATNGLGQPVTSGEVEVFASMYLILE